MKLIYFLLVWTSSILSNQIAHEFDILMGKHHPQYDHYFQQIYHSSYDVELYHLFKAHYIINHPSTMLISLQPKIPKVIHQIWLSRDEQQDIPEQFKQFRGTWLKHHPDWEYKLWTHKDIEALHLENQAAYDAAINYAERSDIARIEILYRFGGLYIDVDFECLQSVEWLHHTYELYAGLELPALAPFLNQLIIVNNGLIGARAGHHLLRIYMDLIKNHDSTDDIICKTGPIQFTNALATYLPTSNTTDVILPAHYFFPIDKKTSDEKKFLIGTVTHAIHHWAGSWMLKEEAFIPGIEIKSNQIGNTIHFQILDTRLNLN